MNRRDSLKLLGAAGLSAAVPLSRLSAGNHAESHTHTHSNMMGAGYYSYKVGNIKVTLITDGTIQLGPGNFGGEVATQDEVKALLSSAFYDTEKIDTHIHTLLLETGGRKILIDCGSGESIGPRSGHLVKYMANAGFKPADITDILITHAHPDHLFGALDPDGNEVFKNAKFHMEKKEWDQWYQTKEALEAMPDGGFKPMLTQINSIFSKIEDKTHMLGEGDAIAEGISTIPLYGHTAGHVGISIESKGEKHLFLSDIAHNSEIFFQHPEWHFSFDSDPVQAVKTRKAMFEDIAKSGTSVSASHMPFPGFGHIVKAGDAYRWLPGFWNWG
jgi:glyoxylase-like metal-dependent hydrolase (beta-lactamase superfamily II)